MSLLDTASLIVTPNGYKEGKLYSVIPSDGSGDLSVTRATTATRVNSAGLVELVPYNLLQYSEQFDNAYWGKNNGVIASNNTSAPDGNTTADKFTAIAGNAFHYVNLFTGLTISETHTFSFYVKKSTSTWIFFTFRDNAINYFNLDTGAFGTTPDSCTSQIVGNGWYRITVTKNTTPANCGIGVAGGNGAAQFNAAGTEAVFIWGAQLVQGTQAKDYQRTETRLNIPRLDYSLGSCPSLLVEPQRTNLALWSEDLSNAAWTKVNTTLSTNSVISPSGVQNADQVTFTSGGFVRFNQTPITPLTAYTISVWVKKPATGGANSIRITTNNTAAWNTGLSQEYTLTTEWQRIVLSGNIISSGTGAYVIIGGVDATGATDTDAIGIVHIWGAQLELGAFPTSYIPTTSASVTRNRDEFSKTAISSLIGQSEGTIFYEFSVPIVENVTRVISLSGASVSNRINISTFSSSIFVRVDVGGANQVNSSAIISVTNMNKIAFRYKANDFSLYVNGVNVITDTSGITFPAATLDRISNLQPDGTFPYNGNIKAIALWKTGLTNAELAALTTL